MSIITLQDPYKTFSGNVSLWVNICPHLLFRFARIDKAVVSTTAASPTGTILHFASGSVDEWLVAFDKIMVRLANGQIQVCTIASYDSDTIRVEDLPWAGATSAGYVTFIENRVNYLLTAVYSYTTDDGATWIEYARSQHRPDPLSEILVNAAPFIKSLVEIDSKKQPASTVNDVADLMDAYCKVDFIEDYDMLHEEEHVNASTGDEEDLKIVDSCAQLQAAKGINLVDFITKLHATTAVPVKTFKWLGVFVKPTYFNGYPFHLTFIYSELMATSGPLKSVENKLNVNGGLVLTTGYSIDKSKIKHVNRVFLQGTYASTVDQIKVFIGNYNTDDFTHMNYSEDIYVKHNSCPPPLPVCLKWMDTTGAWQVWVFGVSQGEGLPVTAQQGTFEKFIQDIATAQTDADFVTKEASPELTLRTDNLDAGDLRGLRTILYSPKVMMLMNPSTWVADGEDIWQTVRIPPGKYTLGETKASLRSMEITIQLTEIYIQQN